MAIQAHTVPQFYLRQSVGLRLLKEAVIEARSGREIVFEELIEKLGRRRARVRDTMTNFFDMKSGNARDYGDEVIAKIERDLEAEKDES